MMASSLSRTPDDLDGCRQYRTDVLAWTDLVWMLAEAFRESNNKDSSFQPVDDSHSIRPLSDEDMNVVRRSGTIAKGARLLAIVPTEQRHLDQSAALARALARNSNNRFHGTVIFVGGPDEGRAAHDDHHGDAGCIRDSSVGNSILYLSARIEQSKIAHAYVGSQAYIESSRIGVEDSSSSDTAQQLPSEHLAIHVGAESGGGRTLVLDGSCTLRDVSNQLVRNDSSQKPAADRSRSCGVTNLVGHHGRIVGTSRAHRILMYPHSALISATHVSNVTLFPHASIQNGCVVKDCLMQWHTQVSDLSTVNNAVLMEQAHVGPHSTVAESLLGPDVHVSNGEIHASILGPNTNAHHQSLLISTFWLCGRGNVGYGANVGSNHTGRSPDQEIVVGEGVFFGLSCVVKFPVNLAPYTLVSAGTQLGPQRMTMPFSLIANEMVLPGWVLSSSPYTLARAEIKVATRRKAVRHDASWPVLRPSTVRQCVEARDSLRQARPCADGHKYSEKDVPGIGACVLTEKSRVSGIRAYTDCIQRYALRGLLDRLLVQKEGQDGEQPMGQRLLRDLIVELSTCAPPPVVQVGGDDGGGVPWEVFPWLVNKSLEWDYQKQLLQQEFPHEPNDGNDDGTSRLSLMLRRLIEMEATYAQQVRDCKRRDDGRGHATIPGYKASHVNADNDPVVRHVQKESDQTVEQARKILVLLAPSTSIRVESKL